jgi:hypothetical protein
MSDNTNIEQRPSARRLAARVAIPLLVLSATLSAFGGWAPASNAALRVEKQNGDVLARFDSMYCRNVPGGGFSAYATIGERDLIFFVLDWHGFQRYTLRYSSSYRKPKVEALDYAPDAETGYGNTFAPKQLHGTVAGHVWFPKTKRGRRIAINLPFGYTFTADHEPASPEDLKSRSISGSAPCRWRKPPSSPR